MPIEVLMPALSPTMTEGTLAKWTVKEGDTVASGDVIAEIETDKATMEVEAVDEGTIGKIVIAEGTENVAVNAVIAYILEEDEDASALDNVSASSAPKADAAPAEAKEEEKAPASSQNRSRAAQSSTPPKAAISSPCIRPGKGLRHRSAQPRASQRSGDRSVTACVGAMARLYNAAPARGP